MEHAAHKECSEIRWNTRKVGEDNLHLSLQEDVVFPPSTFHEKQVNISWHLQLFFYAKQLSEITMISIYT